VGKVRFSLEIAHQSGKGFSPVGNLLSLAARFSAQLPVWFLEKVANSGISRDFRIGRALAISQSHQDIVRD
jgi:hypothetical protein